MTVPGTDKTPNKPERPRARLSRRLLAGFFAIAGLLVVSGIAVNVAVTRRSLEARANTQLANDEAIVALHFAELERQVSRFSQLLADAEELTARLGAPVVARSLTISLLDDLRRNRMEARLHRRPPGPGALGNEVLRKAFFGMRATRLSSGLVQGDWYVAVESATPIGGWQNVEGAVVVAFRIDSAFLHEIGEHISSDITLWFPDGHYLSTLPDADVAALRGQLGDLPSPEAGELPYVVSTRLGGRPSRTRIARFEVGTRPEGLLLLTMPLEELLAARRAILGGGIAITGVVLVVATLLYVSFVRRVTAPLERLSQATRDIAAGNLDLQVPVSTQDEVGELAAAFNTMIERLRESRREIEEWNRELGRRVEERTRSLRETQRKLEETNEQLVYALRRLRETQDSMVQTEKLAAVGQLASAIAHELKNPLAGIRGALELVLPEIDDPAHREVVEKIVEEVDRMSSTTSRLLGFARPTEPHRERASLQRLIENVCFLVGQQAKRQGIEIRLEFEPPDRDVLLDPQLTTQAFLNIALNALQAMNNGGTLTIRTRWQPEHDRVEVRFEDTGAGIPPEVQEKLFTPFFTTKRQGTGLGLYVVRSIVERQGGEVTFHSTPGEGTVFIVRLPISGEES